ncbi:hypothetical protein ABB37_01423 [Leptomonas pyrrhocoris]|uniref:C2HC/C3H-type domain-containing protein n=1 Tax=Leptomonas pyrrhocoris TaxID=157538 RepID=A0A0M9G8J4_LEPPY|nr:hypothetical protein ABB37_01423 [Leptomonas pyrrhocoris]KPA84990.1 hypothetical protein ABB37_01423 [Leptomonas pyrrhocoris]|eukprot:XP_015663429.1 hypothetical protein ABB37_01423 [Leptomonas pyrrhocoris]
MSTPRRPASSPGGLSSNALSSSRKSGSSAATPSSATKRVGGGRTEEGSGLIVTRGLQEILEKDRRTRKPEEPSSRSKGPKSSKAHRRGGGQAPNFVICYLCGRQFGTASIDIHRPQCYLKKMIEWERGDPTVRGPKPLSPEEHEKMMKTRVASAAAAAGTTGGHPGASRLSGKANSRVTNEIELYNQVQMDAYNETALAPCPNCGRTFLPDRLQVHLHSCKPGNTARPVRRASTGAGSNTADTPATVTPMNEAATSVSPTAAAAAASKTPDHPVRVARANGAPTSAGPDSVPPRTGSGGDAVIHARGSYVVPEDVDADSAPPKAPSTTTPKRVQSVPNSNNSVAPRRAASEDAAEEAEPRDVAVVEDVDVEEVKPPSPRADTERCLSSVAILRGDPEMSGSSAPNRPASMEPSTVSALGTTVSEEQHTDNVSSNNISVTYSLSQSRGREHAAGSRPRKQGSASASRTRPMPELVSERCEEVEVDMHSDEDELESAPVVGSHRPMGNVVECTAEPVDNAQNSINEEDQKWTPKKIPLNNISRFRNVESRLKQQLVSEQSTLVPCKYCGRTFVPERIQKHEGCCVERNKPPSSRGALTKNRRASAPASTTTKHAKSAPGSTSTVATAATRAAASPQPSKAPTPPVLPDQTNGTSSSAPDKAKFCGGCGARVSSDAQKFCTECGFKL